MRDRDGDGDGDERGMKLEEDDRAGREGGSWKKTMGQGEREGVGGRRWGRERGRDRERGLNEQPRRFFFSSLFVRYIV